MKRRELLKTAAVGALAGADLASGQEGPATWPPASDHIGIGMIGVGGFGLSANLPDFLRNPDVDVVAICDVFEPNLEKAITLARGKPRRYREGDVEANRLVVGTYREPWIPKGL